MEANTEAIIRLAWARHLGLPDGAFEGMGGLIERPSRSTISYLRLWGHRVLTAPPRFLDRARHLGDAGLADGSQLLAASLDLGGRLLGAALLSFTDDYGSPGDLDGPVTQDPAAVADLERRCPPDDVTEVGLSAMAAVVVLDERDLPLAGAGYVEWEGIIAHLGVLTAPAERRRGLGRSVAALAVGEALDAGLVPQWRCRVENRASRAIARRLGFVEVGSETTVALPR